LPAQRRVPATIAVLRVAVMTAHGKWLITIGDRLSGSLSDAEYFAPLIDGRVEGNKLKWSAKITKPMRLSFKFTAIIEDDRIRGNAKYLLGSAPFSGRRAPSAS
jgi:hypothetical protein